MNFKIKIFSTKKLSNYIVEEILKLKRTVWRHSARSHRTWFKKNIYPLDKHILLTVRNKIVGYVALRKRSFFFKKEINFKKKSYLLFDTLIIHTNYRGQNLSKHLVKETIKISKKTKKPLILICKKKTVKYYKKFNWQVLRKQNIKIIDHPNTKVIMFYKFGINKKNIILNKKLNIYFKK